MIKTGPASAPMARSPDIFATTNSVRSSPFGTASATESLGSKSPNTSQSDNVIVLVPDTPEWEYNNKHSVKRNLHKSLAFERNDSRDFWPIIQTHTRFDRCWYFLNNILTGRFLIIIIRSYRKTFMAVFHSPFSNTFTKNV
jgi:hypothetical protein